jgi:hypothetical protein
MCSNDLKPCKHESLTCPALDFAEFTMMFIAFDKHSFFFHFLLPLCSGEVREETRMQGGRGRQNTQIYASFRSVDMSQPAR